MKILKLLIPFLLFTFFASAQLQIGILGGLHGASVSSYWNVQPEATSRKMTGRTGIHFGFIADIPLAEESNFSFQPGIVYSSKGATQNQILDTSVTDVLLFTSKQSVNYIDIPLNLVYKIPLKGASRLIFGGGPYASLFYTGSSSVSELDTLGNLTLLTNKDLPVGKGNQQYHVLHFGINALGGVEFGKVFITANYFKGMTPYFRQEDKTFTHSTFGATLGVFVGRSNPEYSSYDCPVFF